MIRVKKVLSFTGDGMSPERHLHNKSALLTILSLHTTKLKDLKC